MNTFFENRISKKINVLLKENEKDKIVEYFRVIIHKYSFETILLAVLKFDNINLTDLFYYSCYLESFKDVTVALNLFGRPHIIAEEKRYGLNLLIDDLEQNKPLSEYILLGMHLRCEDINDVDMFYTFGDLLCKRNLDKYIYAWLTLFLKIPREYNGLNEKRIKYTLPEYCTYEKIIPYKYEKKIAIGRIIKYIIESKNADLALLVLDNMINLVDEKTMLDLFDVLNEREDNFEREELWNKNYSRIISKVNGKRKSILFRYALSKKDDNLSTIVHDHLEISNGSFYNYSFQLKP